MKQTYISLEFLESLSYTAYKEFIAHLNLEYKSSNKIIFGTLPNSLSTNTYLEDKLSELKYTYGYGLMLTPRLQFEKEHLDVTHESMLITLTHGLIRGEVTEELTIFDDHTKFILLTPVAASMGVKFQLHKDFNLELQPE